MKRIFFITLSVLLALLLATTATVWWLLHDQGWIKGKAQELVSEMTGRQFLIEGPLDITLSAHPVIEAQGLSLANAPWAEPAEMVHLDQLRMSFDLRSVFTDQFGIHFIEIDGLDLALAKAGVLHLKLETPIGHSGIRHQQYGIVRQAFKTKQVTQHPQALNFCTGLDFATLRKILNRNGAIHCDAVSTHSEIQFVQKDQLLVTAQVALDGDGDHWKAGHFRQQPDLSQVGTHGCHIQRGPHQAG
ncbi:AsmA family protein [Pseudomonadota bacterium]